MSIATNPASKRRRTRPAALALTLMLIGVLALALAGALAFLTARPASAFDERIIFDPYSGLSLGGYDPVAYFVDGAAVLGSPDHEVALGDTYWHFVNEGNAEAFRNAPAVFVPAFGGYSPTAVAEGVAQPGDPTIFTIYRNRVHLFTNKTDRATFLADPAKIEAAATARWPDVVKTLAY